MNITPKPEQSNDPFYYTKPAEMIWFHVQSGRGLAERNVVSFQVSRNAVIDFSYWGQVDRIEEFSKNCYDVYLKG